MSQESVIIMAIIGIIVTIIGTGLALRVLVPGQRGMRRDIAALGESTRKDIESVRKDIAALSERMARLEGLFEGFTKSSPQATPQ